MVINFLLLILTSLYIPINFIEINAFSSFDNQLGNIIILSSTGIYYYNPYTNNFTKSIIEDDFGSVIDEGRDSVFYVKFPSLEISLNLISIDFFVLAYSDSDFNIATYQYNILFYNNYKFLIPYKKEGDSYSFIFASIEANSLYLFLYNVNLSDNSISQQFENIFNYDEETGESSVFFDKIITCNLLNSENNNFNYLNCIIGLDSPPKLSSFVFDIDNSFDIIDFTTKEMNETIYAIKSIVNEDDKDKLLICYVFQNSYTECITYNSKNKQWGNPILIYDNCRNKNQFIDFFYLKRTNEYMFYCFIGRKQINAFLFDSNFNLKIRRNAKYSNRTYYFTENFFPSSSNFVYLSNDDRFFFLYTRSNNGKYTFNQIELCLNNYFLFDCKDNLTDIIIEDDNTITDFNSTTLEGHYIEINFTKNGNVMVGEINETKESLLYYLDDIINQIDIGNNYILTGLDYNIYISPINSIIINSTHINLGKCENKLRQKNNLSEEETITILSIELNPVNEKILGHQVEYLLFDINKNKLDLSDCQGTNILIDYKIYNSSIIDKSMVLFYLDRNIDIFNIEDVFFNDICYPYSMSKTDIILQDRVDDIYQNFSLCEDNCKYEKIDVESMEVKCRCEIKTKIDLNQKPPHFEEVIMDSFRDSNFALIKCYNLFFQLSNKFKNVGFLVILIFIVLHIPLFIVYFYFRIKSIKDFVYKEMEKNNYLDEMEKKSINIYENFKNPKNKEIEIKNKNEKIEIKKENENNVQKSLSVKTIKIKPKSIIKTNNINLRNRMNYNIFNEPSDNNLIFPKTNKSLKFLVKSSPNKRKHKKEKKEKKKMNSEEKNSESNNISSINILRTKKKKKKKVQFQMNTINDIIIPSIKRCDTNISKNIFTSVEASNNKINKNNFNARRSLRTSARKLTRIFQRLLGNEEEVQFPGFYNLIHANAEYKYIRPLDSKYVLDNYDYETAIKYEQRSFLRIYFICLLSKEIILNTFFFKSPLELQSIRFCLFLFINSCDCALNAFFYSNEKISERYHYKGKNLFFYSIVNNLTISIASTLFSFLLVKFLSILTNSKDSIVSLFRKEEEKMRNDENFKIDSKEKTQIIHNLNKIFKQLKIKIISFIIIELSILLFFLYYLSIFCEIYKKTQMSWLADSGISFLLSIPIEIVSALLLATFYYISIKKKWKCIYNISMFFYSLG